MHVHNAFRRGDVVPTTSEDMSGVGGYTEAGMSGDDCASAPSIRVRECVYAVYAIVIGMLRTLRNRREH